MILPLPNDPTFAGLAVYEQVIQVEPSPLAISSSNGLALTLGAN